jgi:hypothetical protein
MSWLDQKYIGLVSPRLERFKRSGAGYVFRCPFCGDSQKNKSKTRGNIYQHKTEFWFGCFNCGLKYSFDTFLKKIDPTLHTEYKTEKFKENGSLQAPKTAAKQRTPMVDTKPTQDISRLSDLEFGHPARAYCRDRLIPESKISKIKYTDNLKDYVVNKLGIEKYKERNLPSDARIVFEMRDKNDRLFGFQARTIDSKVDKKYRFITIKTDDDFPKVYGLDSADLKEYPVFVTEGIIDSLFLPNCLAICGGDVGGLQTVFKQTPSREVYVCLDNEPRSKDTIMRMDLAIDLGYNVMFWEYDSSLKDINDMIKAEITTRNILESIKKNSKRGAAAKLALKMWKKV